MNPIRYAVFAMALAGLLAGPASAAGPTTAPAATQPGKIARIGLVRVDPVARTVSFDANVCRREGVLEFLVVAWQTKTHESILHTKARASHLHAAFLTLGLTPGKPARWTGESMDAQFLPPAGAKLHCTLKWKDAKGKAHAAPAGSWLTGPGGQEGRQITDWIFVGSEVLPDGTYWAEQDGEIVSVSNFASAVVDVPFRSSNVDRLREVFAKGDAIPAEGTKVEVVFAALPGGPTAAHARALLEIDAKGRMRIDGKGVDLPGLEAWGMKYLARHERGQVVIRAAGRALVHDVEAAHTSLRIAGVRDFVYQRLTALGEVLPRTPEQARGALAEWEDRFAHAEELIHDPAERARRTLDQIDMELKALEARKALLAEYAAHLKAAEAKYRASTQPAGDAE